MNKYQKGKCWVCGDNAIGRNFGVISCESCKSFFRRNAFKTKGFKCVTNRKCVINVGNRKYCPKCRLNKCLAVGMKKELIFISNEKMFSDSNKPKRVRSDSSICTSIDSNNSSPIDSTLFDPEFDALFENCCLSEQQINEEIMQIEESFNNSANSIEFEVHHNLSVIPEVGVMRVVMRPIATFNKDMNYIELNRLQELSTAMKCLEYLFIPLTPKIIEFSTLNEYYLNPMVYNKYDDFARQYIKYCKKITSFKEICDHDQFFLVKKGIFESLSWLTAPNFNLDEEYFTMYLGNGSSLRIPLDLYRRENTNFYNITKNFYTKIRSDWISDLTLINLLSALALFNPNRPKLVHKELIILKQQMYLYLLQRYLIQKYSSESESMEICSKLMSLVQESQKMVLIQMEFEKVYLQFTTPLLREFYE